MTRNRDIRCEDIFGCTHEPEIALADPNTGKVVGWTCTCGKRFHPVRTEEQPEPPAEQAEGQKP